MPTPAPKIRPESSRNGTRARRSRAANGADGQTGGLPAAFDPLHHVGATTGEMLGIAELGDPPAPPEVADGARRRRLSVRDICIGDQDESGERINKVYAARDTYAIYRSDNEVRVQYADDANLKDVQFQNVTAISAQHYELDYLTRGLGGRKYYLGQIAVALRIAIENGDDAQKICNASAVLCRAIYAASEERGRIGRRLYLRYATLFSLATAAALLATAMVALQFPGVAIFADLPAAAGSGALGALLSIAIALRGRTVAPDHDVEANRSDAVLRVVVGTLSGGALILFLTAGLFADFKLGDTTLSEATLANSWRAILTFGFLAGFSERLVPDLLERKTPSKQSNAEAAGVAAPG